MKAARHKAQGARHKEIARCAASYWALGVVLALMPAVASPQAVNDPTRPPDALGAGAVDAGAGDGGGGMTLQTVMISPTGKTAIISGVTVKLGQKYGDAVLVKVAETEVVLKSGAMNQVLKLYPGVEKRYIAPAPAKTASRRAKARNKAVPAADGAASPR